MTVRYHPAARRPVLAAAVAMGFGMLGSVAWAFLPEPVVLVPLLGLLLGSVLPFYAVSEYRFGDEGVEVVRPWGADRYPWTRFRTCSVDRNGLVLGGRRPVFLPMDADLRAQVLPVVEARLPRA